MAKLQIRLLSAESARSLDGHKAPLLLSLEKDHHTIYFDLQRMPANCLNDVNADNLLRVRDHALDSNSWIARQAKKAAMTIGGNSLSSTYVRSPIFINKLDLIAPDGNSAPDTCIT